MKVVAGTSGFSYGEWRGSFYPEDLAAEEMLSFYSTKLETVEINNTFYRMPSKRVLSSWAEQVPAGFRFTIKASRSITHMKRLKEVADPVAYLLGQVTVLGERLGPLLFQLPPNMKKDVGRLEGLLALLPEGRRAAIELRHPSWFDDAVYERLRSHDAALVAVDADDAAASAALVPTATWGYLRLRRAEYGPDGLGAWVLRIREQPWTEAFVYFKHEDEVAGPRLALHFLELMAG